MRMQALPIEGGLQGELQPPGDKSISHRALILSSLAIGESHITGLLQGDDVLATAEACRQLGARVDIERAAEGPAQAVTRVQGVGAAGLQAPSKALDMGNSGTAMRLLAGVLAAQPFDSTLVGDESLSRRPMRRVVEPLSRMGAHIETTQDGCAPLVIHGQPRLHGIEYELPVASAQVKSCVLLAGLFAAGRSCIREPQQSRDHTERMLPVFGVSLEHRVCVRGGQSLHAADIPGPADISSAAFFLVAAAVLPGSDLTLRNVGVNPTRDGIVRAMQAMGADLQLQNARQLGGEPVADLRIRHSTKLRGIELPPEWVPSLIDELPALMVLAAFAQGSTRVRGAAELRVKESDRIAVMARGLQTLGVALQEFPDGIDIHPATGPGRVMGGVVDAAGDHRCAMSFLVMGQFARDPVMVDGASHIDTSYPGFADDLRSVGGQLQAAQA